MDHDGSIKGGCRGELKIKILISFQKIFIYIIHENHKTSI